LRKNLRWRSIGSKVALLLMSISALPRNSSPSGFRAKPSRETIRAWLSALKYISALRQVSRSMREIGASCSRSLRPKITLRRRSGSNWNRTPAGLK
jgi:hypothetical protein